MFDMALETMFETLRMFPIYVGYVFSGLLDCVLAMCGRLEIQGEENIPSAEQSALFPANHPSLQEPIILPGILFWAYYRHATRWNIWSAPDQNNYHDHWFWGLFRKRYIPIPREAGKKNSRLLSQALLEIIHVLRTPSNKVIFHPEAGRTCVGKHFVYSKSGKRMAVLKTGIGVVVRRSGNIVVVPVWIDCVEDKPTDKVTFMVTFGRLFRSKRVTFGKPILVDAAFREQTAEQITAFVESKMLETADLAEL